MGKIIYAKIGLKVCFIIPIIGKHPIECVVSLMGDRGEETGGELIYLVIFY